MNKVIEPTREELQRCRDCKNLKPFRGLAVCGKLQREMFRTPLSCFEARCSNAPCGPNALLFDPLYPEEQMTFKVGHPIPPVPRTLQQAFGPHTSRHISEPRNRSADRITVVGCLFVIALLASMLAFTDWLR